MSNANLRQRLIELTRSPRYQPLTRSELARRLEVPSDDRQTLRLTLADLVAEGTLILGRKSRYEPRARSGRTLVGRLRFHPAGHAFFHADPDDPDNAATGLDLTLRVRVARQQTATALDGDRVRVTVHVPRPPRADRRPLHAEREAAEPTGRVDHVLERRSNKVVGIFRQQGRRGWVETDDKALSGRVEIAGDTTARPGQLVVVDLTQWQHRDQDPRGRIIEVLGWPGDSGVDILAVIRRHGLRTAFPEDVLAAARTTPEVPDAAEIQRRKDWRDQLVITIDPGDAKDHDDAIWLRRHARGWTLAVHIADVAHYVKPGSPLDREARERGNSTYLVDRVLPMLPVELSNGICSLKPFADRLTKCVLMEISPSGETVKATYADAVIHSRAKLSYEQAQAILDGQPPPPGSDPTLAAMVCEGWKMASTMRARRFAKGSLDLEMPETRVVLDDEGRATQAEPVLHTPSHQLIEECMLAANEAVARLLRERGKPAVFRVHEDPDPGKLADFAEEAKLHGYHPGDLTNRSHLQRLLAATKGKPEEPLLRLALLKSLKRAAYSADPLGHFGLAKRDYCHFTSPIRRYADLLVHRALQPHLENRPRHPDATPSYGAIRDTCRHISDTERISADAENETKQIKLLEYLEHCAGQADGQPFAGLITEARPMGLMVELAGLGVRGLVKREDLPPGRWYFEGHRMAWTTPEGRILQSGMAVPLRIKGINRERRFVDFVVAAAAGEI
ncbi:MAG: VacB/RNase II family 3'-5' exoribonuclease, partial [Akkermansiaceae bacterium]|nr:VacB/RNase II family 3'-5' exoribonuclease [Akkermansiaceae bacterium]